MSVHSQMGQGCGEIHVFPAHQTNAPDGSLLQYVPYQRPRGHHKSSYLNCESKEAPF